MFVMNKCLIRGSGVQIVVYQFGSHRAGLESSGSTAETLPGRLCTGVLCPGRKRKKINERESSIVVSIHNYFCHGFDLFLSTMPDIQIALFRNLI